MKDTIWIIMITVLVAALAGAGYYMSTLEKEKAELQDEYSGFRMSSQQAAEQCAADKASLMSDNDALQARYDSLKAERDSLQSEYDTLNQSYTELGKRHESLDEEFKDLRGEVDRTITKIEEYESDIQESIEWFNENSLLSAQDETQKNARLYLNIDCVREEDEGCYIKSGCPWLVNQEKLGLRYKSDIYTTGEADKLQSLSEFIESKGGDCEDYALFYKAEWHHMVSECQSDRIIVDSWVHSDIGRYWMDWDKDWYLDNARPIQLEYGYPSVVCGWIYDLNEGQRSGHCIVAFTKDQIMGIDDLDELDGAMLIEPQNGMYMGKINGDSAITLIRDGQRPGQYQSYISVIITDNDYFGYSEDSRKWQGYSIFLDDLSQYKDELRQRFWQSLIKG